MVLHGRVGDLQAGRQSGVRGPAKIGGRAAAPPPRHAQRMIRHSPGTSQFRSRRQSQPRIAFCEVGHLAADGALVRGHPVQQPHHAERRKAAAYRLDVLPPRSGHLERAKAAEQASAGVAHHDGYRPTPHPPHPPTPSPTGARHIFLARKARERTAASVLTSADSRPVVTRELP